MIFASREEAGGRLGRELRERSVMVDRVAGLPRGGVVVAAEVARVLGRPLDILVVRKIGHPWHREFAVGALAEAGVVRLDESSLIGNESLRPQLQQVIEEEQARLRSLVALFHSETHRDLKGKVVLLIDDGIATGATLEAAAIAAKKMGARRVIAAAPVASEAAVERLRQSTDAVRVLLIDPGFQAVGQYYRSFEQTSDEEVLALLKASASAYSLDGQE